MWIADLAAHGLIKASFVPDEKTHGPRTLMRTRKQLAREQTRHVQRIEKTLTSAPPASTADRRRRKSSAPPQGSDTTSPSSRPQEPQGLQAQTPRKLKRMPVSFFLGA